MRIKALKRISAMVLAVFVCFISVGISFAKEKKDVKKIEKSVLQIETTGVAGSNDALVLFEDDITEEVEKQYSDYSIDDSGKDK